MEDKDPVVPLLLADAPRGAVGFPVERGHRDPVGVPALRVLGKIDAVVVGIGERLLAGAHIELFIALAAKRQDRGHLPVFHGELRVDDPEHGGAGGDFDRVGPVLNLIPIDRLRRFLSGGARRAFGRRFRGGGRALRGRRGRGAFGARRPGRAAGKQDAGRQRGQQKRFSLFHPVILLFRFPGKAPGITARSARPHARRTGPESPRTGRGP